MSRITCTVELVDGSLFEQIRILPLDIVRMERHYQVGVAKLEKEGTMLTEHGAYLAWSALTRTGQWSGDFDTFMEQLADASPPEGDLPDPTSPAP